MSEKIVKIGVIGLIRGASVASQAFHHKQARVTAVCDIDEEKVKTTQELFKKHGHDTQGFTDVDDDDLPF